MITVNIRGMVAQVILPQQELKEVMPKLRALRATLMALKKDPPLGSLPDAYALIAEWEDPGLMKIIDRFYLLNFVGDFDRIVGKLQELQQLFFDTIASGIVTSLDAHDEGRACLVLDEERLEKMIKLIGDLEFEDSAARC